MSTQVSWQKVVAVNPQNLDDFEILMNDMIADARRDDGLEKLEWSISLDQGVCHVTAGYGNSDAALRHLTAFRVKFAGRFHELSDTVGETVYGEPDSRVRNALPDNAVYMVSAGGFNRCC